MIKPSEFPKSNQHADNQAQDIENYIDEELRRGCLDITPPRAGWDVAIIERVLQKYRDAGWKVNSSGYGFKFSV